MHKHNLNGTETIKLPTFSDLTEYLDKNSNF